MLSFSEVMQNCTGLMGIISTWPYSEIIWISCGTTSAIKTVYSAKTGKGRRKVSTKRYSTRQGWQKSGQCWAGERLLLITHPIKNNTFVNNKRCITLFPIE